MLAKVYINLIDQKEPSLDFLNTDNKTKKEEDIYIQYYKKIIKPAPEELQKHEEYLKNNLKKNYFN